MFSRVLSGLACALVLATTSTAQDNAPDKLNALYFHPGQVSSMAVIAGMPLEAGMLYLQADYERYLKPGLSGFGSISYFSIYNKDNTNEDADFGFLDLKAGVRLYPGKGFSGFYLQPVLNYNRIFVSLDNYEKSFDAGIDRFGGMAYLGFNGKWDMITVDWNVGIGILGHGDLEVEVKDKESGLTYKEDLGEEAEFVTDVILINPTFGTNFAVGFQF